MTFGGNLIEFSHPCAYFTEGKAKASTLSLSVLVAIEMFNALNALSEVRLPARPHSVAVRLPRPLIALPDGAVVWGRAELVCFHAACMRLPLRCPMTYGMWHLTQIVPRHLVRVRRGPVKSLVSRASQDNSLLTMPPWINPWLLAAEAVSFGLHFLILYVPALANIFGIVPLSFQEWLLVILFASPVILIDEVCNPIPCTICFHCSLPSRACLDTNTIFRCMLVTAGSEQFLFHGCP